MLKQLHSYLRIKDWADSKVPFMCGVLLFAVIFGGHSFDIGFVYLCFGAYTLYVSMFLAFSYVINDYCDMDVDKQAGKKKLILSLPKWVVILTMVLLVSAGTIPMFFLVPNRWVYLGFTLLLYLLGAAYSSRRLLRFKERGLIGLLECSLAQRCLPLIPAFFLFELPAVYPVLFLAVSFINGLRYILIHQAMDLENDIRVGVKTYLTQGHHRYRTAIIVLLLSEIGIMLFFVGRIVMSYWPAAAFVLFYIVFERTIGIVVTKYMGVDWLVTFLAVPLEDLYHVFFPLLLGVILLFDSAVYIGIPLFLALLTFNCFKGKFAFIKTYIRSKRKTRGSENV